MVFNSIRIRKITRNQSSPIVIRIKSQKRLYFNLKQSFLRTHRSGKSKNYWFNIETLLPLDLRLFVFWTIILHDHKNMSTKKESPVKKPSSPFKKAKKNISVKLLKNAKETLTVYGIDDTPIEIYVFEKGNEDAYSHPLKRVIDDDLECEEITRAGFVSYFHRRQSFLNNTAMRDGKGYARVAFIRYLNGCDEATTEETRQEGLNLIKWFFSNSNFVQYPVTGILTEDKTGLITSLDRMFLNEDIHVLMQNWIPEEDLNESFYPENPERANKFYSGNEWAHRQLSLGYPTSFNGNVE